MKYKLFVWIGFFIMVAAQLYVPSKMIFDHETILKTGKTFKFQTAPIDPTDPFRGKYITLSFAENTIILESDSSWQRDDDVYVWLTTNENGFASISNISHEAPGDTVNYVRATVLYAYGTPTEVVINYPFDRFYMDEWKAPDAEFTYREAQRDTSKLTYALVHIKNGQAAIEDVQIDGVSINDLVIPNKEE